MAVSARIKMGAVIISAVIVIASLGLGIIVLMNENNKLQIDNQELLDYSIDLNSDYNESRSENEILTSDLDDANDLNYDLTEDLDDALDENEVLETQNLNYSNQITKYINDTKVLNAQIITLQAEVSTLVVEKFILMNQTIVLQSDIDNLTSQISSLQYQISELNATIADLWDENDAWWDIYYMRTGEYPQWLVTPDESLIVSTKNSILGSNANGILTWSDMDTICTWVHNQITYSYDQFMLNPYSSSGRQEFWQTPSETLDRGEGDCDDFANLALSLMFAEQKVGWLWGTTVVFDGTSGHAAIFVNVVNDTMFIYDPTWGWDSGTAKAESTALTQWAVAGGHSSVTRVNELYDESSLTSFSTLSEFYSWF